MVFCCCFFFQAEDGIRDWSVTGVQTCALPILFEEKESLGTAEHHEHEGLGGAQAFLLLEHPLQGRAHHETLGPVVQGEIGRASCRERVEVWGGGGAC